MWEHELNATVDKLDHLMLLKECAKQQQSQKHQATKIKNTSTRPDSLGAEACPKNPIIKVSQDSEDINSLPSTPEHVVKPMKKLLKLEPLPLVNVSMRELPLLARLSNEIFDTSSGYNRQRRRSLN